MFPTQIPAIVVSVILYGVLGIKYASGSFDNAAVIEIQTALSDVYNWNILLLLPLIIVIGGVALKFPIIPTLVISSLVAVVEGAVFQGMSGTAAFNVLYSGVVANTGNAAIDDLLSGGGLSSMMSLILTIFCAFSFAGIVERVGLLKTVVGGLAEKTNSRGMTILLSMISGIASVYLTASVYVAEILNCRIWNEAYKKQGMSTLMNARTQNACMSNWGMIVPWSGGVAVMANCFGLTWSQYAPYLFMTWACMFFTVLWGFTGKFMIELEEDEKAAA
jgi:NhaC family Na+:H+ antiporter